MVMELLVHPKNSTTSGLENSDKTTDEISRCLKEEEEGGRRGKTMYMNGSSKE
jgi:hypothetical protein